MKNKLLKILCLSLIPAGTPLFSQHKLKIGLDAGYTYNVMNANLYSLTESRYTSGSGAGGNLSVEYNVWKNIFVSTGVSFWQKNYNFERTGTYAGWYTKYSNNILSFPLLAGGYLLGNPHEKEGIWIKLAGGMYTDYWLRMKRDGRYLLTTTQDFNISGDGIDVKGDYTQASDTYDFKKNENQLNRWGYGLQGQAQIGYALKKIDLYAAYNYQYGLSDINKSDNDKNQKMSFRSYMISAGIAYKFK
ncbi:outer membrane beta-barrel protein [Elizabethkingia anophelis]|nr:outer membrane beta-barrel protein [Elizabethkingia anophelis]